ncbi:MAG: SusF/SusE family outer membrane protein [Bacteroidales bacterium]|nr:SusF/SusE family outer membrane protein [Bacteroidales bacterium]
MKKSMFKKAMNLSWILIAVALTFTACKKDNDTDPEPTPEVVEDGLYIKGDGTALTTYDIKGLLKATRNEVLQEERAELLELYVAVKAGAAGFNLVDVVGGEPVFYGPANDYAKVAEADLNAEEPTEGLWKGSYTATETPFTVDADGLYHVVIDTELKKVTVAKVVWGLIGGATPGGWGESTQMAATFNLNKMEFVVEDVLMLENEYKFRYSNGWKIILDEEYDLGGGEKGIRVNTNLGGAINALVPGGDNIAMGEYGEYKFTMTWELGKAYVVTVEKTGDGPDLPSFPDAMYLVGAGTAYGWDTPGTVDNAVMHKCAGGAVSEGIYWKICHLEAGQGFKVSDADWGVYNYGYAEIGEYDAEGVAVSDNGGNMDVAESGMYIIVLNLRDDAIKLSIKAAEVYGIGDAFGSWDEDLEASKFIIDNAAKTLTSPALTVDGAVRMYAQHSWIPAWWNAEFNVFSGVIEYRNDGGDQEGVTGTAGQVVTLTFDDNTGSIN